MMDELSITEKFFASIAAFFVALTSWIARNLDKRIRTLETKVPVTYLTKHEFWHAFDKIEAKLDRISEKLDRQNNFMSDKLDKKVDKDA